LFGRENTPPQFPEAPTKSQEQESRDRVEMDRSDLLQLVAEVCPGWDPAFLTEEIDFMPLLDIQKVRPPPLPPPRLAAGSL